MRPTTNWATFQPANFNPQMSSSAPSRTPISELVGRDSRTYPSGSAVNAYGTFLPLFQHGTGLGLSRFRFPYTVAQGANAVNTVQIKYANKVAWINPNRSLRMKGLTELVPGIDTSQLDAIQQYLGNAQG